MVVLVPVPLVMAPPGLWVRVQVPDAGSPFRVTLPVARLQVGWTMVPRVGAVGVIGAVLMTTGPDAVDIQPSALVTV